MFYVYMLQDGQRLDGFYIGFSSDLRRRLTEHNDGKVRATRGRVWTLVYYEAYRTRAAAQERERVLKGDGRTRRHLTDRVVGMLDRTARASESFNGGEWQTGE